MSKLQQLGILSKNKENVEESRHILAKVNEVSVIMLCK